MTGEIIIYRTAKVLNAADHTLDAYKTTKGFAALQKTEKGLYALAAANGMGEGITGRDFLGNKLTEEQKQQSLIQAFSILGLGAAGKFIGGKPANIPFNTYSKQYDQATAKNAQNTLREIGKQTGKVDVPVGAKVLKMATNGPIQPKVLAIETKTLSEVKLGLGEKLAKKKEQKQVNKELSGGSEGIDNANRLIPGTPGNPTSGDPTKLGKNLLESMGLPRSTSWKGYQAQHIIPSQLNKHPVIKKIGMEMNDSTNGIFLPIPSDDVISLSRHRGFHTVYNNVVRKQLDKMDVNQDIAVLEKQVYELQQKLKKGVENGLPLYKTKINNIEEFYKSGKNKNLPVWNRGGGATEELWERWLSK
ncbi:A nuclease family of the HNH/ENDO VII superfamily with conserved AHH [Bacillus sp. OV322]|uniref:AHH domain-containing protein n=1 Tax=Bacillus sp. OV322 TaxID=1882764 RepID=UPI0008EE2345|nr:AHH domain-containing protein [Bacillus sp. OV322]SFC78680.1 A nuclease family of the HNH/ENDO VII superfamily with conserved AHH [Bacillus sp. OV322]